MTADAIRVRDLSKTYAARGEDVVALEKMSFSVPEGTFIAVVGPSGCGKSTLLKILAGLLPPSTGEALLRGTAITGARRDIGVVFQSPVLFPWRSVLDNVLLPVDVHGVREVVLVPPRDRLSRVDLDGARVEAVALRHRHLGRADRR